MHVCAYGRYHNDDGTKYWCLRANTTDDAISCAPSPTLYYDFFFIKWPGGDTKKKKLYFSMLNGRRTNNHHCIIMQVHHTHTYHHHSYKSVTETITFYLCHYKSILIRNDIKTLTMEKYIAYIILIFFSIKHIINYFLLFKI